MNHQLKCTTGIPANRFGTMEDIYLYEDFLQIGIVVISARAGNRKVYPGSSKYENKIFLYHSGLPGKGHFDTIVKVNALLCKQYYCDKCDKGFKNRTGHKCEVWCNVCGRENCEKQKDSRICPDCNKEVRSQSYFLAHKLEKKKYCIVSTCWLMMFLMLLSDIAKRQFQNMQKKFT